MKRTILAFVIILIDALLITLTVASLPFIAALGVVFILVAAPFALYDYYVRRTRR